jgi:hypothetical protein
MEVVAKMYMKLNSTQIKISLEKTTKSYKHGQIQIEEYDPMLKIQRLDLSMDN